MPVSSLRNRLAMHPEAARLARLAKRRARSIAARLPQRRRAVQPRPDADVLVAGWFSWPNCSATVGDVLAADVVCRWLDDAGRIYDVARSGPLLDGVDFLRVDPARYRDVVFVCGPMHSQTTIDELLDRFPASRHLAVDVSMIEPLAAWNPFDVVIERDSDRAARPDLAFAAHTAMVPLVGVSFVEPYPPEYPDRDLQGPARAAVEDLVAASDAAFVEIDTRLEERFRRPVDIETLSGRLDAMSTTRMHGLVLALKHRVPVVAVDPVLGGAKIMAQARTIGWPAAVTADEATPERMGELYEFCLSEAGRAAARAAALRANELIEQARLEFLAALSAGRSGS
ncbi:MAG TPA: hypothetical protein VGV67_02340 [Solirubrobacteraceae bacterium]|nr:hypothetical protein [Solirubrobacteraceae bacterium]